MHRPPQQGHLLAQPGRDLRREREESAFLQRDKAISDSPILAKQVVSESEKARVRSHQGAECQRE